MPEVVDELKLFLTNLAKGSELVDAKDLLSAGIGDKSVIQNIEAKLGESPWNVQRLIDLGIDTIQSGHADEEENEDEHELEQRQDSSDDFISDLGSARVVRGQLGPPVDGESYGRNGEQSGPHPGDGSDEASDDFTANDTANQNGNRRAERCDRQGEIPMKETDLFHTNIKLKSCASIAEEVKREAQESCINLHPVVKEFICLLVFLFARIREEGARGGTSYGGNPDKCADVNSDGQCGKVSRGRTGPTAEYEEDPPNAYPRKGRNVAKMKYLKRSGQKSPSACKSISWKEHHGGEDPSSNSNCTSGESNNEEGNFPFSGYSNGKNHFGAHYRNSRSSRKSRNNYNRSCHHEEVMKSVLFTLNEEEKNDYNLDDIEQALEEENVKRVCEKVCKHMQRVSQMKDDLVKGRNFHLITSLLFLTYTHLGLSLLRWKEVFQMLCHVSRTFQQYRKKNRELKKELEKKVNTYMQKIKMSEQCIEQYERMKASYEDVKRDNDKLKKYDCVLHRLRTKIHLLEADKVLLAKRKEELELVVRRKGAYFVGGRQGGGVKTTSGRITKLVPKRTQDTSSGTQCAVHSDRAEATLPDGTRAQEDNTGEEEQTVNQMVVGISPVDNPSVDELIVSPISGPTEEGKTKKSACHMVSKSVQTTEEIQLGGTNETNNGRISEKEIPSDRRDASPVVPDTHRTCGRTALVHVESTHLTLSILLFMRRGGDRSTMLEGFHFGEVAQFQKKFNRGCLPVEVVTPLWRKILIEKLCSQMEGTHLSGDSSAVHRRLVLHLADIFSRFTLHDQLVDEIGIVNERWIGGGVRFNRECLDRVSCTRRSILSHLLSRPESTAQSGEDFISSFCWHFFRGENELTVMRHGDMCVEGYDSSADALSVEGGSENEVGGMPFGGLPFDDHLLEDENCYTDRTTTQANASEGLNYFGVFPHVGVYVRGMTHHWLCTVHTARRGAFPWNIIDQKAETHTNRKTSQLGGGNQLTLHGGPPLKEIYPSDERHTNFYVDKKTHEIYVPVDGTLREEDQLTGRSPNELSEWTTPQMGSTSKRGEYSTSQYSPKQSNNPSRKFSPLIWEPPLGVKKPFLHSDGGGKSTHGRGSCHRKYIHPDSDLIPKGHRYGFNDGRRKFFLVAWRRRVETCYRVVRGTSRGRTPREEKTYLNKWGNRNQSSEFIKKNRMWMVAVSLLVILIFVVDTYLLDRSIFLCLMYCVCLAMLLTASLVRKLIHMVHVPFGEKIISQDWLDVLCVYFIRMVNHFHRGLYEGGGGTQTEEALI